MAQLLGEEFSRVSDEVYYSKISILEISKGAIQVLKQIADSNSSKKVRICCHKSVQDNVHEMLLVIKRGVVFGAHKHLDKSESFHVIEGRLNVHLFDEKGALTKIIEMGDYQSDKCFFYRIDEPVFHTVVPETEYVVYHEVTKGPFDPADSLIAKWDANANSVG